jgi:branched-chain amino acid transport system permease protein
MSLHPKTGARPFRVAHSDRSSRVGLVLWGVLTVVLVTAPFWAERQTLRLLTEIYSYGALASLWNLLAGYAGLVSVGQQAFVGLGAYVLFGCGIGLGLNPLWGIPAAGVVGGLLAVPVALLLFRLRGAYFAIGSWVIAESCLQFAQLAPTLMRVDTNVSLPAGLVKGMAATRDGREFLIYWLFLALVIAVIGIIVALLRTRYGLALTAIRDNEIAAKSNGIDVNRTRLVVFVVASSATALAGGLIYLQKLSITPISAFNINTWTVDVIFMTVIGGIGRVEGPLLGTVIFFILRQLLADEGSIYLIILGVVAIVVMLRAPRGLWGLVADRYGWQLFPLARRVEYLSPKPAPVAAQAPVIASEKVHS